MLSVRLHSQLLSETSKKPCRCTPRPLLSSSHLTSAVKKKLTAGSAALTCFCFTTSVTDGFCLAHAGILSTSTPRDAECAGKDDSLKQWCLIKSALQARSLHILPPPSSPPSDPDGQRHTNAAALVYRTHPACIENSLQQKMG